MRFDNCFVTNSHLRAQPGGDPDRQVQPPERLLHQRRPLRRLAADLPQAAPEGRLPDGDVGKWHLETDPTGFDYWNILHGQGPYYNPPMIENGKEVQARRLHDRHHHRPGARLARKKRDKSKPFLLMYQHKAPHRNWQPGPKYLHMYDDVTIPEPDTLFDDYSGRGTAGKNAGDDDRQRS